MAASYLFYGCWDYRFLLLLFFVSLVSFRIGAALSLYRENRLRLKTLLAAGILINAGVLFVFKYFGFFAKGFRAILSTIGFDADWPTMEIVLPVGLSFYIFQAVSYIVDVYRNKDAATSDAVAYFAYISFFPQLVAGPIERASDILPQFERSRRVFTYEKGVSGMKLILWGLFKKMVVADNMSPTVNSIFANYNSAGTLALWLGALFFSVQIYCDFSGYSDIARGSARLFDISLRENFKTPYFSINLRDFWRRWHISLMAWFRDYIYIPLGGSRSGKLKAVRNTSVVFFISGMWHGANLTFIVWGLYHAVVYIPSMLPDYFRLNNHICRSVLAGRVVRFLTTIMTFVVVIVGFVIFRSDDILYVPGYIEGMFWHFRHTESMPDLEPLLWTLVLFVLDLYSCGKETPLQFGARGICRFTAVRWMLCIVMFAVILIFSGNASNFIYFKF